MSGTNVPLRERLFRAKSVDVLIAETHGTGQDNLKRTMGLMALTMFSVGSIVGTGIFVILGTTVPTAGPAIIISFILAGVTCTFSALSYAEMAGSIPISGSSYSYSYATMGELIAWICGWCLMLEYGVSVAAVAAGWSQYVNEIFKLFGFMLPDSLTTATFDASGNGIINIPAIVVVCLAGCLLLRGASESATVNTVMVFIKIGILAFFCVISFTAFQSDNFEPFAPFGWAGISAAAGVVFFSFIGFDTASTAGEEAKNPRRDLPRAIILSLIIVTTIYVVVALAALGAMNWSEFAGHSGEAVLSIILQQVTGESWPAVVLSVGAIISIFSVVLAVMYGQTRILFAMGRDGLLPKFFTKVNLRTQTPVHNTVLVIVVVSIAAGFFPLGALTDVTSIGTLTAFALVNISVIVLRRTRPDLPRTFKTPFFPVIPVLGVIACVYLVISLQAITWLIFAIWMTVGFAIYFGYGFRHSNLAKQQKADLESRQ